MNSHKLSRLLIAICLFVPLQALAEDIAHHRSDDSSNQALQLSPKLREILVAEMLAVQDGMKSLIPAISSGNWQAIAETGRKIHDSYIMKQKLSKSQVEELHRSLPGGFLELDHSFHHSAGMLAHAAEQKNADVVNFYFFKLNEACVSCHSKFAAHRFPGFARGGDHEEHHP